MASADPSARVLDLTRLVSRLGHGPLTGVDRVELAYLEALLDRSSPLYGLVQTAAGYLLLDRIGVAGVAALVSGGPLGPTDLLSRLTNWRSPRRGQAEATVRRLSIARATRRGLHRVLRRVPDGASYLNVGHSNLSDHALACIHRRFRIAVLVHDTIPLDHPDFSRPDTLKSFRKKLAAMAAHADLIIHTTHHTRPKTEAHLRHAGRVPPGIVAPLGVPRPIPTHLPAGVSATSPYFLTLGTVEPRKNHALLLQIWDSMARHGPVPQLFVVGGRGWAEPQLFDKLQATPGVSLLSGLSDGEVAALMQGAAALLFPSHVEGFGLPPVEAAALGTPVIASDLAVIREILGDYPVYLSATDSYSWMETVKSLSLPNAGGRGQLARTPPSWVDHFNIVLTLA